MRNLVTYLSTAAWIIKTEYEALPSGLKSAQLKMSLMKTEIIQNCLKTAIFLQFKNNLLTSIPQRQPNEEDQHQISPTITNKSSINRYP